MSGAIRDPAEGGRSGAVRASHAALMTRGIFTAAARESAEHAGPPPA